MVNDIQINLEQIPGELKKLKQWILWKLEITKGDKYTKIPYQISGYKANVKKSRTWDTIEKVIEVFNKGGYSGIGFVLSQNDEYVGIDFDECINDDGIINENVNNIIENCNSYAEISQSGQGVHMFIKGNLERAIKRKEIEMYSVDRYFTFTGNQISKSTSITSNQELINTLYSRYSNLEPKQEIIVNEGTELTDGEIKAILDKAFMSKNGFKIEALYNGEWNNLYQSQSEADQALCNYLAFWLDKNSSNIDRAFRDSKLYRQKWEREDYKSWTINKAINACKQSYQEFIEENNKYIEYYDFSDLGIAQRFKDQYKDILKYAVDTKYFYHWDNKRWVRYDDELLISSMAIEFVEDLAHKINIYIKYLDDEKKVKIYMKILSQVKNDRTIKVISNRYKSFRDTHISSSIMDSNVRYINCSNGVVDTTTGGLLPHNREMYISKIVNVNYIPNKTNILYKKAVNRLFDDNEEVEAFEILLGYMLSGKANQKTFPIIQGGKDSGKSKIFELILATLGSDYVKSINKELLMKAWNKSSTSANPELAELQGIRLLICSETNEGDYFNTDFIKKLVGGDTIKARPLYKPPIDFRPIFVPVIFTNGKPSFDGNDSALVGRLMTIELLYALKRNEIDPDFEKKVLEDKEGLFSYLISCIVRFNKTNKLIVPQRWENSKLEYVDENNMYKEFKIECLKVKKGDVEFTKEVYAAFENWCMKEGVKNIATPKRLTMELKKLGIEHTRRNGAVYLDIFLLPQWRRFDYISYFK